MFCSRHLRQATAAVLRGRLFGTGNANFAQAVLDKLAQVVDDPAVATTMVRAAQPGLASRSAVSAARSGGRTTSRWTTSSRSTSSHRDTARQATTARCTGYGFWQCGVIQMRAGLAPERGGRNRTGPNGLLLLLFLLSAIIHSSNSRVVSARALHCVYCVAQCEDERR